MNTHTHTHTQGKYNYDAFTPINFQIYLNNYISSPITIGHGNNSKRPIKPAPGPSVLKMKNCLVSKKCHVPPFSPARGCFRSVFWTRFWTAFIRYLPRFSQVKQKLRFSCDAGARGEGGIGPSFSQVSVNQPNVLRALKSHPGLDALYAPRASKPKSAASVVIHRAVLAAGKRKGCFSKLRK